MSDTEAKPLGLYETLKLDLRATGFWNLVYLILSQTGYFAVFLFRLAYYLLPKGRVGRFLAVVLTRLNTTLTACDIQPVAKIGPGFNIVHSIGVAIGPVTVGKNFTIYQNVTLARANHSDGSVSSPVIGDNVIVYSGACVLGKIRLGNGCRVGANAVVLKDVPDGMIAVGVPAKNIWPKGEKPTEPASDPSSV